MPIATRTFRVFVSSTFEDLKEERDALQREVFPRLRKLCESHGARFQAIDLRWGVRDEAALDQKTMEICLREIERCQQTGIKPNFIVLLGERYGWRPLPTRIDAAEFNTVYSQMPETDKHLIDEWYRCDDNAVPPEFVLNPRTGDSANPDHWKSVEQKLHHILEAAAQNSSLTPEALIKYQASATHQEILKGLGGHEDDRKHVFAFFCETPEEANPDADLKALKEDLERKLPTDNVRRFQQDEIEKLCHDVEEAIKGVILNEVGGFTSRDALELEVEVHDRFAADRSRCFVGRSDALDAIATYIRGSERRPLVLHGASGAGKSAVMAKTSETCQGRVIRRFIGASPESVNGFALLTSLCQQIAPGETPTDYSKLEQAFQDRLAATAEQPLILFIDALDQLAADDPARAAQWLPAELPPHVKIVVSTTDHETYRPAGLHVPLAPMTPMEGGLALDALLHEARRTLQDWQRNIVFEHFARCGLPLYLKLAAEESRLWKSFDPPESCRLGEGIAGIIDTLFDRLSSNANHGPVLVDRSLGFLAAARYGLTETEMLDVLASDDSVWSDFDKRKHHEVSECRLPVVIWSRLSLDLEPYLTERAAPGGAAVAFYHRQLAERAAGRFLADDVARNADLACYFRRAPTWLDDARKNPNARKAAELTFQQRAARQWTSAEETLFDCQFLMAKTTAGMVRDLDDDFALFLRDAPVGKSDEREAIKLIHGAIRLSVNVLLSDSKQFASQIVGRLLPFQDIPAIKRFAERTTEAAPRPWLRSVHPALHPPGTTLLRTLEGHTDWVEAIALMADGRRAVSVSHDKTLKIWDIETGNLLRTLESESTDSYEPKAVALTPDDHYAVSTSYDTLLIWDLVSGHVLRTLEGHTDWINAVALTKDGRRVVSVSNDKTLKVWDFDSGRCLHTLDEIDDFVENTETVALTADGRRAIAGGASITVWDIETGCLLRNLLGNNTGDEKAIAVTADDRFAVSASGNSLNIWDIETGRLLRTLKSGAGEIIAVALTADGHHAILASGDTFSYWDIDAGQVLYTSEGPAGGISAIALTADRHRAISSSYDKTLKVWDIGADYAQKTHRDYKGWVTAFALTEDGRRVAFASNKKTLNIWDIETDRLLHTLDCNTGKIAVIALAADGHHAVTASYDTLNVWDIVSGRVLHALDGHSGKINSITLTTDGRRIVSASDDHTLKVWDFENGRLIHTLDSHTGSVSACALTADGRRAVSASQDTTLKVWDLENGHIIHTLKNREGGVYYIPMPKKYTGGVCSVALTADGRRAVSGFSDGTLNVWNIETASLIYTLEGHTDLINAVALTADGRRAFSASYDKTFKIWDLDTGSVLPTPLDGHTDYVEAIALTADGRCALSASRDKTLKVWDAETGAIVATFTCDSAVYHCAFAASDTIVAGDAAGRVHFLRLEKP